MKPITSFLFLYALVFNIQAQSATEKTVTKMCDCITESKDTVRVQKDVEALFFKCFMRDAMGDIEKLMKENKVKTLNEEGGRQIGVIVGQQLAVKCPAYMEKIGMLLNLADEEAVAVEEIAASPNDVTEASGVVTGIETGCFTVLNVRFNDGTTARIYWLHHFVGEEKLPGSITDLKDKSVRVGWQQGEIRMADRGRYETVNELVSLSW